MARIASRLRRIALVALGSILALLVLPPSLGGRLDVTVVNGTSMEPALDSGDLAITWRSSSYDVGDVIVYATAVGGVVHRVVAVEPDGDYVTRGDNRETVDDWRPDDRVVRGRVVAHVPAVGRIVAGLQARLGAGGMALGLLLVAMGATRARDRRRTGRAQLASPGREIVLAASATGLIAVGVGVLVLRTDEAAWSLALSREATWRACVFVLAASACTAVGGWLAGRGLLDHPETLVHDLRLGTRLVDADVPREAAGRDVGTVDALRAVADALDLPVVRTELADGTVRYVVEDGDLALHHDVQPRRRPVAGADTDARSPMGTAGPASVGGPASTTNGVS